MQPGDPVRVKILSRHSERSASVIDVDSGQQGVLLIKGSLRNGGDGLVNAWVLKLSGRTGKFTCGNAYFGKYSILPTAAARYVCILNKLNNQPEALIAEDLSCLKGMCNRCLKMDQWDWFTTYKYLGYPERSVLRRFIADAVKQRDLLRQARFDGIPEFKANYQHLLGSMLFHLSADVQMEDGDNDIPVPGVDAALWARLSSGSRDNIRMAERIQSRASVYVLMHYFVTLEQEFNSHFVRPFQEFCIGKDVSSFVCLQERYQRTHDVLTGKSPLTLGAVHFLGELVNSRRALEGSEAIRLFAEYLGTKKTEFSEICASIANEPIGGVPLPQLRNGLAHGDASIIARIDGGAFHTVRALLFEPPKRVMCRLLFSSMKFDGPCTP